MVDGVRSHHRGLVVGLITVVAAAVAAIAFLASPPQATMTLGTLDGAAFGIAPYTSPRDQDGDGIDDQSDILASARVYCASRPTYGSAYYEGGYPDDGRGVCTDLVAAALLNAGYDLRLLVDADIHEAPEAYEVETPDANIDYRRVRNLRVWFARHAQELTCDASDIDQWQGGDIVCYANHIGIVSDRRNTSGVPYLIHHRGRLQRRFEEDCLASYGDIVGHWRLG